MSNTTLRKLHQQKMPDHWRRILGVAMPHGLSDVKRGRNL
jgi:hypothetical protein